MLPSSMQEELRAQIRVARELWEADRAAQRPGVEVPFALERKYPTAAEHIWRSRPGAVLALLHLITQNQPAGRRRARERPAPWATAAKFT